MPISTPTAVVVIGTLVAFPSVEQSAEDKLRTHGTDLLIGEHLQMYSPVSLKICG
jgi:hypothetical protein